MLQITNANFRISLSVRNLVRNIWILLRPFSLLGRLKRITSAALKYLKYYSQTVAMAKLSFKNFVHYE